MKMFKKLMKYHHYHHQRYRLFTLYLDTIVNRCNQGFTNYQLSTQSVWNCAYDITFDLSVSDKFV